MARPPTPPIEFLQGEPEPVRPVWQAPDPADLLPQPVADRLLQLPGVDGAWIERDAAGARVVVLHYTPAGRPTHLPATVEGLPVKVVGGEPIRAGG